MDRLGALAQGLGQSHAELVTETGDPVDVICAVAERVDADVIVVGCHDKHLWERLLRPSVSGAVIRHTHRPVLVVSGDVPPVHTEQAETPLGTLSYARREHAFA